MKPLILVARLIFGAWMLVSGANYLFFSLWPMPTGHEPLAIQLMAALVHSRLLDVVMTIQLVTGALILAGFFVPVALCVVMPISTCALYWSVILDHQLLGAVLALVAFALNGLLMLAYLDYYQGALQRHALALGESERSSFDRLFTSPAGRTSRSAFVAALITLLVVAALYVLVVTGRTAQWCVLVLLYPALVLHARRLHDMGHSGWLVLAPGVLLLAACAIWLRIFSLGAQSDAAVCLAALAVSVVFALWGCVGRGQPEANSFGPPVSLTPTLPST
jgi:putative oxidoreductase